MVFVFLNLSLIAQERVHVFDEIRGDEIVLFANNEEYCPVILKLELTLQNLFPNDSLLQFIVPSRAQKHELISFKPVDYNSKANLNYDALWYLGNSELDNKEKRTKYILPYKIGKEYEVLQVENGNFSHSGTNAIDIAMPEGAVISAARGGLVVAVEESNSESCLEERCKEFGNFITIYHEEAGLFTHYVHLMQNGALVEIGDSIIAGQEIALSGNTGYSAEPHLHFEVFQQIWDKTITHRVGFVTSEDPDLLEFLKQDKRYKRKY